MEEMNGISCHRLEMHYDAAAVSKAARLERKIQRKAQMKHKYKYKMELAEMHRTSLKCIIMHCPKQ